MGFFFLLVAAWAGYGIFRLVRAHAESRRYLEAAKDDGPLQLGHLSVRLRQIAMDTRLLRISLESSVRDLEHFLRTDLNRTAEDFESLDGMLLNVTRELADWVRTIERLPELERARLEDLGVSEAPIRSALDSEGWNFERRTMRRRGMPDMDQRLRNIMAELAKVETTLQLPPMPYR